MYKLKTNSGAKKRFNLTKGKKVLRQHSGKRHGMIKKSKKQIRNLRRTIITSSEDAKKIKKYFIFS